MKMNVRSIDRLTWLTHATALASVGFVAGFTVLAVARQSRADDPPPETAAAASSEPSASAPGAVEEEPIPPYRPLSKVQLRRKLSSMQYRVTQEEGTEPPFRNRYWDNKQAGTYRCVVCELPLFSSQTKFKSGTGWPSFYAPLDDDHVGYRKDWRLIYTRIEVHCKRCDAHLGHVFDDGPRPTGKRYCMNSASLKFSAKKDEPAESTQSRQRKP